MVSLCRKNALPFGLITQGFAVSQLRVMMTLLHCSDSTIETEKFDAIDCMNSTVGETGVVGCATGYKLASATVLECSRVSARTRVLLA